MKKGINKGTNNSSNSHFNNGANVCTMDDLPESITDELKKSANPLSTSDLTFKLGKAWHTIDRACLMLQIAGKIEGFRVGKMNLWRVNEK